MGSFQRRRADDERGRGSVELHLWPGVLLSRSGITGWLGYWEKDVYRITKPATATRVSVRTLPNDGEYLQPKLCIAPVPGTSDSIESK